MPPDRWFAVGTADASADDAAGRAADAALIHGGAGPAQGSGIIGLIDRVEALGGKLTLRSPLGEGTSLVIELPLEPI
ncbi:MAG TPA: hypothetical protein VF060_18700 [Trebonia sp.]